MKDGTDDLFYREQAIGIWDTARAEMDDVLDRLENSLTERDGSVVTLMWIRDALTERFVRIMDEMRTDSDDEDA